MTLTSKIQQHLFFSATTNKSCSAKVKKKMDHRNHLTSKLHSQALNSKTNVTLHFSRRTTNESWPAKLRKTRCYSVNALFSKSDQLLGCLNKIFVRTKKNRDY